MALDREVGWVPCGFGICFSGQSVAGKSVGQENHRYRSGRVRVLVATADRGDWQKIAGALQALGCQPGLASDGLDLLRQIVVDRPDLMLLAAGLPVLDAFRACALIKGHSELRHLPVFVMVPDGDLLGRARARLAGAEDWVTEPPARAELTGLLAGLGLDCVGEDDDPRQVWA